MRSHDLRGLAAAAAILGGWGLGLALLLPARLADLPLPVVVLAILAQTFLSTGLFITAHDGMHGTICPRFPRLNHAIGALSVALYAAFDYRRLREAHHGHHRHPASEADPDFHDGRNPHPLRWYLAFMRRYLRWPQVVIMAVAFNVLHHLAGIPVANLLLFWVLPAMLSTLQLFFVGTWLPHREPAGGYTEPHRARSLDLPPWLSLLACYHFGYHLEHHEHPATPWWRLPRLRSSLSDPRHEPPPPARPRRLRPG